MLERDDASHWLAFEKHPYRYPRWVGIRHHPDALPGRGDASLPGPAAGRATWLPEGRAPTSTTVTSVRVVLAVFSP